MLTYVNTSTDCTFAVYEKSEREREMCRATKRHIIINKTKKNPGRTYLVSDEDFGAS